MTRTKLITALVLALVASVSLWAAIVSATAETSSSLPDD